MSLPRVATRNVEGVQQLQRVAETVNSILSFQHDDSHIRTKGEAAAGIFPVKPDYDPGEVMRYGAAGDGVQNEKPAFDTTFVASPSVQTVQVGTYKLDADVTVPLQDLSIQIDAQAEFTGAGLLIFNDILPYQHEPTFVQNYTRKTYGPEWDAYYGIFLLGALAEATGDARAVGVLGQGLSSASGSRAWGGNLIGSCTVDGAIAIGLEVDAQIIGAGNTTAAAYCLVIASSGDLPVENAIQIQNSNATASFRDGIVFDLDAGDANITGSLIRREGSGTVSCENFISFSGMSATVGELDLPSFAVQATQANTANRLSVRGGGAATNPRMQATGTDTNLDVTLLGKGSGGVQLVDGALAVKFGVDTTGVGFFGTSPIAKQTITGSRGGNAALADLLTKLAAVGLITDGTTA